MEEAGKPPLGWHSRGFLPHFDSPERIQHIVIRAFDSLPVHLLDVVSREESARRSEVATCLDRGFGVCPFGVPEHAEIVQGSVLHFDAVRYRLLGWCVMPNHVHVVIQQIEGFRLGDIVKSWKQFSARAIGKMLGSGGSIWARDYFDRYVRNEAHLEDVLNYVENNPVAARLVDKAENWRFSSASRRRN